MVNLCQCEISDEKSENGLNDTKRSYNFQKTNVSVFGSKNDYNLLFFISENVQKFIFKFYAVYRILTTS